ncbi:hypothetical protein ACB094_04G021400 [Castanea mollissima]
MEYLDKENMDDVNQKQEKMEDERKIMRKKKKKLGGIKTMPFIFTNEICDKFAATGFHANMITYLTQELNMPLIQASNTLSNFTGTANFMPLFGALISDSFAGRFWTIMVGSIIYELPMLQPPPCPTQMNRKEALALPCVVTFAADQFDMTKSSVAARSWNLFNWYYFSMGMATITALTFVVYIQDNVGWGWGLGLPTIAMTLSIIAFSVGSPLYNRIKPAGSPFVRLAQVIVAAVKKRKEVVLEDSAHLYENRELDAAISLQGRLLHTNQFNKYSLNGLAESSGILLFASSSHLLIFNIQQAHSMNRHLSHSFQIPTASLSIFSNITMLIGLVLYERLFVPFARQFTGNPSGITCLQRMGVGYVVNILATIVASFVEIKRKAVASDHNLLDDPNAIIPITAFWLAPQFCLHGVAEVFMSVGHLEFLYYQSPESMRSTALALYWIARAIHFNTMGNYVGTLIVSLIHKNLNRGRLECYYWLVRGSQVINLVYYVICSWLYTYKPLEEVSETCKEEVEELDGRNGHGEVEPGLRKK